MRPPGSSPRSHQIPEPTVRRVPTDELRPQEIDELRDLLWAAFGDDHDDGAMTEEDWEHALGGTHVLAEQDGRIVAHAAVVERTLHVGDRPVRTGYVEAVATAPDRQSSGFGTSVMEEVGAVIREGYDLGGLGTGAHHFYERLGWITWRGPTAVHTSTGLRRTPDEDGYIMVLRTPTSPPLDLDATLTCDERSGDAW